MKRVMDWGNAARDWFATAHPKDIAGLYWVVIAAGAIILSGFVITLRVEGMLPNFASWTRAVMGW